MALIYRDLEPRTAYKGVLYEGYAGDMKASGIWESIALLCRTADLCSKTMIAFPSSEIDVQGGARSFTGLEGLARPANALGRVRDRTFTNYRTTGAGALQCARQA